MRAPALFAGASGCSEIAFLIFSFYPLKRIRILLAIQAKVKSTTCNTLLTYHPSAKLALG